MKHLALCFSVLLGVMHSASAVLIIPAAEMNRDEHSCLWKVMSRVEIDQGHRKGKSYAWEEHGSAVLMTHGSRYYGLSAAHIFPSYNPLSPTQKWFLVKPLTGNESCIPILTIRFHEHYFMGSWAYDLAFLGLNPFKLDNITRGASLSDMGRKNDPLPPVDGRGTIFAHIDFGLGPQLVSQEKKRIPRRWEEEIILSSQIPLPSSEGGWLQRVWGDGQALWKGGSCFVSKTPLSSTKKIEFLFEKDSDKVIGIYSRGGYVRDPETGRVQQKKIERLFSYFADPGLMFYPAQTPSAPEEYIECFTNLLMYEDWLSRQIAF